MGDDGGCFEHALAAVYRFGGVLEHPEGSHAFRHFKIRIPKWRDGWVRETMSAGMDAWVCCVAQGHYGHRARKLSWLLAVAPREALPDFDFSIPAPRARLDRGFHSSAERKAAVSTVFIKRRLSRGENMRTPPTFAEWLVSLAQGAK